MFKLQVDVDHNGKVDLREFVVMMYNQVDAINKLYLMLPDFTEYIPP